MESGGQQTETKVKKSQCRSKRRRGQRGSIFRRGGSWTVVYRLRDGRQKWEGGYCRKEEAQNRLDDVLGAIRTNRYVEQTQKLFHEFCDEWMDSSKVFLKPRTWITYRSALKNWILPALGDVPLSDIRKADVLSFLYGLLKSKDLSRKFVKNLHILIHRLFEAAIERELVVANPAHKIRIPEASATFVATDAIERVVPTPEEVVQTLTKLPPNYQALLVTSAVTGMRRAELLGLQWQDIDWERGLIHIRRSLQRVPKHCLNSNEFREIQRIGDTGLVIMPPKSKKAVRFVEMPPKLATILKQLRSVQVESDMPLGGPVDPDSLGEILHGGQDRAQVRRFGLHGLRHLYCSLLQESGAPLKFAQERLGHANPSTTLNVYTHVVNDHGRELAGKVEDAFGLSNVSGLMPRMRKRA